MNERSNRNGAMKERMELPDGWVIASLEEVCEICDNLRKPINSTERIKRIEGKSSAALYPYYGATGLVGYIDDFLTNGEYILLGEDAAPFLDFTKNVAYIISGKAWVNNHAHILLSHFNNKYLLHFLNQFSYKDFISGTTRLKLTQGAMKKMPVRLAPLPEQHRIVAKIEALFSSLDRGIASLKTAQEQLKIYRQAVLKWAFEGKLTNEGVKDGELPEGWKWVNIDKFLLHPKKGMATGPFGTALKKEEHQKSGIPVLGIENIGEGRFKMPNKIYVTKEKAIELHAFQVYTNDIIISRSGTVGEICSVPEKMNNALISTNLIRVRLNQDIIAPKFFVYIFQGGAVREQVEELCKGSTRAFLNQTILNSLNFPYCKLEEQHNIVAAIESRLSVCDKLEETILQSLQQAEALRQSILKKAFAGQLVPQDPNDEPASVLLERIQAERLKATTGKIVRNKKSEK